jgi:phosphotransferase system enzyme I (PtsI)
MEPMQGGREYRGRAASEGVFIGPLVRLDTSVRERQNSGDPATEREALDRAIARAVEDIAALAGKSEGEAAEILGFQVAMLEDDALCEPALIGIGKGEAADKAWSKALDAEIVGYELSDDEYFRARAADLKDIRDRVLRNLAGLDAAVTRGGVILAGEDVAPSLFLETDWSKGGAIALTGSSPSSHVAMLARARGVPMIVGLGEADFAACPEAIVDGEQGLLMIGPDDNARSHYLMKSEELARTRAAAEARLKELARLKDGTRIEVLVNVAGVDELDAIDPESCDGIGLMRSEFLFRDGAPLPDEESQYRAYRRFLEWAGSRPVTIRTLDIGGDKPIRGLTPAGEKNPFLGLRGIRLMLARPDVFRVQLRALARAAVHGNLKIMLPMVTVPDEITRTAQLLDAVMNELAAERIEAKRPPLGIMVEVPAVAIAPELFTAAAFFSIGSNDLTQYVTAASRDETSVASLNDPAHPAVQRLIASVAAYGRDRGTPVSICGDMAGDRRHVGTLIGAGLRSLSVAPAALATVKSLLAEL